MTLIDQYNEAQNPQLQARVQMATVSTAQAIGSEDPTTPNHQARVNLASQVTRAPNLYTVPFTTLLTAEGITNNSTDGEIESMVSAVWNTMAGNLL